MIISDYYTISQELIRFTKADKAGEIYNIYRYMIINRDLIDSILDKDRSTHWRTEYPIFTLKSSTKIQIK